jgi:hypothetical protein
MNELVPTDEIVVDVELEHEEFVVDDAPTVVYRHGGKGVLSDEFRLERVAGRYFEPPEAGEA